MLTTLVLITVVPAASVVRLVRNNTAEFDRATLEKLVERATQDAEIAADGDVEDTSEDREPVPA